MRLISRTFSLAAICLGIFAHPVEASPPQDADQYIVLEPIETAITEKDSEVLIDVRWGVSGPAAAGESDNAPPVFLSNGVRDLAVRATTAPSRTEDGFRIQGLVRIPRTEWAKGCWQASYRLEGVIASGPEECLNEQAAL